MLQAALYLADQGQPYRLVYMQEPGRYRVARDRWEAQAMVSPTVRAELFDGSWSAAVILTHMRPEVFRGHLAELWQGVTFVLALGYINRGDTLVDFGLQFANRAASAHVLEALAAALGADFVTVP